MDNPLAPIEPEVLKRLDQMSPAELQERSRDVSRRLGTQAANFLGIIWYEAAPVIDRVERGGPDLWERMGFAKFPQYLQAYWKRWHRRTIENWLRVYRRCAFLTHEERTNYGLGRLVFIAQRIDEDPGLLDGSGQPTPELRELIREVMEAPYEDLLAIRRARRVSQAPGLVEFKLMLRPETIGRWEEWLVAIARHQDNRVVDPDEAMTFLLHIAMESLEVMDRETFRGLADWVMNDLKAEVQRGLSE